jgi:F-type H+-transporting ATPase subunit a
MQKELFNLLFLNALEQFDIVSVFRVCCSFGFNNFIIANTFLLLSFFFFFLSYNIFFFSFSLLGKINIFFFVRKLLFENLNMRKFLYFRFFIFIFIYILFSNFIGLIPYSLTTTSFLVLTLYVSFTCFIALNLAGFKIHLFYIFSLFVPEGTPFALIPFLILIEFISYFARVASLSIRLFANMMAGHTLLKILSNFL